MPDTLQAFPSELESPRDAFAELRASRDDFSQFFGDLFDELQALSLQMYAQHQSLEANLSPSIDLASDLPTDEGDARNGGASEHASAKSAAASLVQLPADLIAAIERCIDELRATHEALQSQGGSWRDVQLNLAAAQNQISDEASAVLAVRQRVEELAAQFSAQLADMKSDLHRYCETVAAHCRQAEEDRRLAAAQHAELSGEVKNLRLLMETFSHQLLAAPSSHGPPQRHAGEPVASDALPTAADQAAAASDDASRRNGPNHRRE